MKLWRALTLLAGLGAVMLTIETVASRATSFPAVLWHWPANTWAALFAWRVLPALPGELARIVVLQLIIHGAAVACSVLLAWKINRPAWDWGVLVLLFPPAATVLAWISPGRASQDRLGGIMGRMRWFIVGMFAWKSCGRCRKSIPVYLAKGSACPHCGIAWSGEKTVFERFPGEKDRSL